MHKIKNNRAFTLIELIVVMAIIGILVLLATPKFLNYINEAKYTNITSDIKVLEDVLVAELSKVNKLPINHYESPVDHMEEIRKKDSYIKEGRIILGSFPGEVDLGSNHKNYIQMVQETRRKGENPPVGFEVTGTDLGLAYKYYKLDNNYVRERTKTRLKGSFLVNKDAMVIYIDDKVDTNYIEEMEIEGLTSENFRIKGKFRGIEGVGETFHTMEDMQALLSTNEFTKNGIFLENLKVEPEGRLIISGKLMTTDCWHYLKGFLGNKEIPYRMTIGMEKDGKVVPVCKIAFEKDETAYIEEIKK